jgi:DNA-binding response OmpR family regulator
MPAAPTWRFDPARQAILGPQGQSLSLSQQEFSLFSTLAENPSQVFSKQALHEQLFPDADAIDTHRIDVILNRIRKKAQDIGLQLPIRAVFGRGLTFLG